MAVPMWTLLCCFLLFCYSFVALVEAKDSDFFSDKAKDVILPLNDKNVKKIEGL